MLTDAGASVIFCAYADAEYTESIERSTSCSKLSSDRSLATFSGAVAFCASAGPRVSSSATTAARVRVITRRCLPVTGITSLCTPLATSDLDRAPFWSRLRIWDIGSRQEKD